ncbi:uncharacterized protein EDB91DRAFT_1157507 [Suillus paluster]|uniref:uncharacterized protein n=1 Tax=Suillus paluster TaxID=48578 RepID=UPI001B85EC33|nr:uncharacterized protein EDB91DRAFT_1157507 [Suillus paluster]KAG1730245.1 hypothetical protein EDB91DRAFT_1157507 [Suillus paluster]
MKSISLTTMIMSAATIASAAAMAVTATAQIIGHSCAQASHLECGTLAGHNHGYPFLFMCGPDYTITRYQDCTCYECCEIDSDGGSCL